MNEGDTGGGHRVRTCQAAEGQGPGGLVCWWLRSQTHLECYEGHPAQPGAETPPCKGGVRARVLGPSSASALPVVPLLAGLSHRAPCLVMPCVPLHAGAHSLQCPTPKATAPFSFIILSQNRKGRDSLGSGDGYNLSHIPVPGPRLHSGSSSHLSITPPESPLRPRLGAKESSSSKKITHGAAALALANTEERATGEGLRRV